MQIYIHKNGEQFGPFEEQLVRQMLLNEQLSPNDLGIREGDKNWRKLENIFPANPNSLKTEVNSGGNKISKLSWLLFYLFSILGFLSGILSIIFALSASELYRQFNYFGYKPSEIMPLFLIGGIGLIIQFPFVHYVMESQLNRKLWGVIGLEAIYTLDSLKGKYGTARKARTLGIMQTYRSNRWILFQENYERFLKNNQLPMPNIKMNSLTLFGKCFQFPLSMVLYFFQPFIFLYVISQVADIINSSPVKIEQIFNKIDVSKYR